MAAFQRILNWINSSTAGTAVIRDGAPVLGNLDLPFRYAHLSGQSDPLDILIGTGTRLHFEHAAEFTFHAPRTIGHTPFMYTYGQNPDLDIRIVDFVFIPDPGALYRIMMFQSFSPGGMPAFRIAGLTAEPRENLYRISEALYLKTGQGWKGGQTGAYLNLSPVPDRDRRAVAILQIGKKALFLKNDDPDALFTKLGTEEQRCQDHFPGKYFFTGHRRRVDQTTPWIRQRVITPDGRIDPSILRNPAQYAVWLPWLPVLGEYLPHTEIGRQLREHGIPKAGKTVPGSGRPDEGDDFHDAFFGSEPDAHRITTRLQQWWDRYTLPVYRNRWGVPAEPDAERLLVIFLLALKYKLPWAPALYDRCSAFSTFPFFNLIAGLARKILLQRDSGGNLNIIPGPLPAENVRRTPAGDPDSRFAYTRFGKETYFSIWHYNRLLLKIDKEVGCVISGVSGVWQLRPNVFPVRPADSLINTVTIGDAEHSVVLPLAWRQGTVQFKDLRIRWLLKKRRFQLTLRAVKNVAGYRLNDIQITLAKAGRRIIHIYPERIAPAAGLSILSEAGSSLHFRQRSAPRRVRIVGWLYDHFGVFYPHINYRYSQRQHVGTVDPSGQLDQMLPVPPDTGEIRLQVKNIAQSFHPAFIRDARTEDFVRYDPQAADERCLVILGRKAGAEAKKIRKFFQDEFGFLPELLIEGEAVSGTVILGPNCQGLERGLELEPPLDVSLENKIRQEIYHVQG